MVEYSHPLYEGAKISQPFGANPNNGNNGPGGHNGHDYAVPEGTPVKAVADGVIEFEGWVKGNYQDNPWWLTEGAGIVVVVDHGDGNPDSLYGHLSRTVVNKGQAVKRGQVIGYVGSTGNSSGPHLHFSMFPPGFDVTSPTYGTINPDTYLKASSGKANAVAQLNVEDAKVMWRLEGSSKGKTLWSDLVDCFRAIQRIEKTLNEILAILKKGV